MSTDRLLILPIIVSLWCYITVRCSGGYMKSQIRVIFALLISLITIPLVLCDEISDTPMVNKLACICSSSNQSFAADSKCSTSCDCSPAGSSAARWTCICGADKDPEVIAGNLTTSCFTSCNCTSGSSGQVDSFRIWIFSKSTVIILLIFGFIMSLAFIASMAWYTYGRNKYLVQKPLFASDKESVNSHTKLISHQASSVPEYKIYIDAPSKPITGCIHKASFIFRNKKDKIPGTLERFSYSELEEATEKFSDSNLIGVGASSHVYRGHLRCGKTIAVKRLKIRGGPDFEAMFLTEIELISRLHHFHVVPLLGYCLESQGKHVKRLLVFEYMQNGNLRECLDGNSEKFLDWSSRVAIALGAAKGLEYLHEAAAPKILHSDVKSTNVLLDEKMRAKITDLGMAKHLRGDDLPSCPSSPARMQGTFGYFAPEYAIIGRATLKSDVFSFGVVLLELITGRHPINRSATKGEESLVIWATPRLLDSKRVITELPDSQLKGDFPEEEMHIMAYLAKECLLLDPDSRPSMSEVVQILSTIAPEKSRRQNFSISLFQNSFHSIKSEDDVVSANRIVETEELKEVISSGLLPDRCSLPLHMDQTLCADTDKMLDSFSEDIDGLLLLTTKQSNQHLREDEVVDISEPRFESFCVEYVRSSA